MLNNNIAVDSGNIAITKNTGVWTCKSRQESQRIPPCSTGDGRTDGVPCHHEEDTGLVASGFSEYASRNDATVGDDIGRMLSSVLVLDRLKRGDEGSEEYGDSFCAA